MQTGHFTPAAPRRHAVSRRILDGLIGLFLVALTGCGGGPGDNVEADHHKGMAVRYLDGAERHATSAAIYAIWLDTEACVTGSSGLAVPPVVDFLPVEELPWSDRQGAAGLAYPSQNRIELPHSSLRPYSRPAGWVDDSIMRHEFTHLILHQSGMSQDDNHGHRWGASIRSCSAPPVAVGFAGRFVPGHPTN